MGPGGGRWVDIISPLTNPELYDHSEITELVSGRRRDGEEREGGNGRVRKLI